MLHPQSMDTIAREKKIRNVTLWGALVNLVLTGLKLLAGVLGHSAAMLADGPVTLRGAETVAKSYPTFWRDMAALGGRWEVLET